MIIIGLSGKKQSGKDTVCSMIQNRYTNLRIPRVAFADALKEEVAKALEIDVEEINANKKHFRTILQWWGTEWRRSQDKEYWLKRLQEKVDEHNDEADAVIVTDCRFPNEADLVMEMGGYVIQVIRDTDHSDSHPSETSMDGYAHFYHVIYNMGSLDDLRIAVANIVDPLFSANPGRFKPVCANAADVVRSFMEQPSRPIASHSLAIKGTPAD